MAVVGYELRINGGDFTNEIIDVGNVLEYDLTGLDIGTEYDVEVRSYDGAGNRSLWTSPPVTERTDLRNHALAANGGTASADSTYSGYSPAKANDGVRHTNNAYTSNVWLGASTGFPRWLEIDFGSAKTIERVDVFSLADALNYNTDPGPSDTFTQYGLIDFKIQTWNGSSWVDQATITGNDLVWRQITFTPVSTQKVRIYVTAVGAGAVGYTHVVELEAWGT